jgi:hypothetical protein
MTVTERNPYVEDFIPLAKVAANDLECCPRTATIRLTKAGFEPLPFKRKCGLAGSDLTALRAQAQDRGITVAKMLRKLTANPYPGAHARWGINSKEHA